MFSAVGDADDESYGGGGLLSARSDHVASRGSTRSAAQLHPAADGGAANYNVRVALDEYDEGDDDDDDDLDALEADVMGREQMKKSAMGMLDKAAAKGKKKKKGGKFGAEAGKPSPGGATKGAASRGVRAME